MIPCPQQLQVLQTPKFLISAQQCVSLHLKYRHWCSFGIKRIAQLSQQAHSSSSLGDSKRDKWHSVRWVEKGQESVLGARERDNSYLGQGIREWYKETHWISILKAKGVGSCLALCWGAGEVSQGQWEKLSGRQQVQTLHWILCHQQLGADHCIITEVN